MHQRKEDPLKETLRVWQPFFDQPLSPEQALEIRTNVLEFFRVLASWRAAAGTPRASRSRGEAAPVVASEGAP